MTSQPGTRPPEITDGTGTPAPQITDGTGTPAPQITDGTGTPAPQITDGTGTPGATGRTGSTGTPGPGRSWPLVLPLALLIILGLAGLRGEVTMPRWDGPLRHDGPVIGLVLEVILAVLLVITMRRRSAASKAALVSEVPPSDVAAKLRGVLLFVLGAGMVAVAVATFIGLHLHAFSAPLVPPRTEPRVTPTPEPLPRSQPATGVHVSLVAVLYGLLIAALVAAVVLSIWWSRRFRVPARARAGGLLAEDPEDLREAVESGRSALRTFDDARAAIIACYLAMEDSLAERGAARAAADTPDELLARATRSGVVHGTAAARLTALFYEARFSTHPLGPAQRDAAEQTLGELAAALTSAEPTRAGAGP